jgi:hypothetical protein
MRGRRLDCVDVEEGSRLRDPDGAKRAPAKSKLHPRNTR